MWRRVVVNPLGCIHDDLLELQWPGAASPSGSDTMRLWRFSYLPCLYKHLVFKVFGAVIADRASCYPVQKSNASLLAEKTFVQ